MSTSLEQIKAIKPGLNYPAFVRIEEPKRQAITFLLQSYYVGTYCAIHVGDSRMPAIQTGDRNNKTFVTKLKRGMNKALVRGATMQIGALRPCRLTL
jgi:hypothetical protein